MNRLFPSFLLLSAFLLFWELYSRIMDTSKILLPAPSDIIRAIFANAEILRIHTAQTVYEALIGISVAIILGVGVAIIIFLLPRVRAAVYPLLVLTQTIPMIALAPLLLVWFGFDLLPKVIIVVLYCFFPIAVAVTDGLTNVNQNEVELLESMRARSFQILKYVRIPAALPMFFSGLRISVTYAITGAIVGEYVGAYRGLGVFMQTSANSHAIVLVFAAVVITALVTVLLLAVVSLAERIFVPWKKI